MEQRTLRLGDIVDDYCPRERRLTNHAIVAIVEDSIRQTRCTTCDSEHVYKGGQEPKRRLVKPGAIAAKPADQGAPAAVTPPGVTDPAEDAPSVAAASADDTSSSSADASPEPDVEQPGNGRADDLWIGNRPLIRATLPRVEGDPPPVPRPIPEFTMHQRQTRGAHAFRHGHGGQNPNWSGNGHPRGGFRDGRGGGQGQGNGGGNGNTQGQRPGRRGRRRGGKKNR